MGGAAAGYASAHSVTLFFPPPHPISCPCQLALARGRLHAQLLPPSPPAQLWPPSVPGHHPATSSRSLSSWYTLCQVPGCTALEGHLFDAKETPLAAEVVPWCPMAELAFPLSLACSLFLEVSRKPSFSHICQQAIDLESGSPVNKLTGMQKIKGRALGYPQL